jgi:hypothetical protein
LKQNAKQRRGPTPNDFAIPPQGARRGRYPIQDQEHAIASLAKVDAEGTAEEKRKVHNAVRKRYPNLRPDPARPDPAARPDGGRPDAGRPDMARADGGRPDAGRPDMARADGGRADTGRANERSSIPGGQVPVPRIESGRTPSKTF